MLLTAPWVQPANPIEAIRTGASIGAEQGRIAQQGMEAQMAAALKRQQLAQQANEFAQSTAAQKEQLKQQSIQKKQELGLRAAEAKKDAQLQMIRLGVESAYNDTVTGLKQQELDRAAQEQADAIQAKRDEEALRQATMFQARQQLNDWIEGGGDPAQGIALLGPQLFPGASQVSEGIINALKRPEPPQPFNMPGLPPGVMAGGRPYWPPGTASATMTPYQSAQIDARQQGQDAADRKARRAEILKQLDSNAMLIASMYASKPENDPSLTPEKKAQRKRYLDLQAEYDALKEPAAAPAAPAPAAAPSTTTGERVRVRDKKTGKTGWWTGGTPPPDQYEIIE